MLAAVQGCWFCFDLVPILTGGLLVDYCDLCCCGRWIMSSI